MPVILTGSGHYMCSEMDCLVSSDKIHDLLNHHHSKKPIFDINNCPEIFYNLDQTFVPKGLEKTAIRVDKHYHVAVCLARQMVIPRHDLGLHTTYCSYCNYAQPEFENDLIGIIRDDEDMDFGHLYTVFSNSHPYEPIKPDSLPPPLSGSRKALCDLCLNCTGIWAAVTPTQTERNNHKDKFHNGKSMDLCPCMFSQVEVSGQTMLFPVCAELENMSNGSVSEGNSIVKSSYTVYDEDTPTAGPHLAGNGSGDKLDLDSHNGHSIALGQHTHNIPHQPDAINTVGENVAKSNKAYHVNSPCTEPNDTKIVFERKVDDADLSVHTKHLPLSYIDQSSSELESLDTNGDPTASSTPVSSSLDQHTEINGDYTKPAHEGSLENGNGNGNAKRKCNIKLKLPDSSLRSSVPRRKTIMKINKTDTSHEKVLNRIMSIAFLYIQSCLLDVFDQVKMNIIRFCGLEYLSNDFKKVAHIRQFTRLIGIIFRGYLYSNVKFKFTGEQKRAIEDLLRVSKKCKVTETIEKLPLEGYENVQYRELISKVDLDGTATLQKINLGLVFVDYAKFGYQSLHVEDALQAFQKVMIHLMTEEYSNEAMSKWNVVSEATILQLHMSNGKALETVDSIDLIDAGIYNWRLIALRIVMDSCDSRFETAFDNPWFAMAHSSRDSLFFLPLYTIRDEIFNTSGQIYRCNGALTVIEGRSLAVEDLSALALRLVQNSWLSMLKVSFDSHYKALQALSGMDLVDWDPFLSLQDVDLAQSSSKPQCRIIADLNLNPDGLILFQEGPLSDEEVFDLLEKLHECDALLDELATLTYLSTFDISRETLQDVARWNFASIGTRTARCLRLANNRIMYYSKSSGRWNSLPWVVSELIVQYLTITRPVQIQIVRRLGQQFGRSKSLEYELQHYLFVSGITGRWNGSDFANTIAFVTAELCGQAITPAIWKSAASGCHSIEIGWESAIGKGLLEETGGAVMLNQERKTFSSLFI